MPEPVFKRECGKCDKGEINVETCETCNGSGKQGSAERGDFNAKNCKDCGGWGKFADSCGCDFGTVWFTVGEPTVVLGEVRKLRDKGHTDPHEISVFVDNGWGDDPTTTKAYSLIVDGDGQDPVLYMTETVFDSLYAAGWLDANSLTTFKARRVHDVRVEKGNPPGPAGKRLHRDKQPRRSLIDELLAYNA